MEERQVLWVFYLIMVVMLLIVFYNYVNKAAQKSEISADFIVKDISLLVNGVYLSPGKVSVEYDTSLPMIKIENGVISAGFITYNYMKGVSDLDVKVEEGKIVIKNEKG